MRNRLLAGVCLLSLAACASRGCSCATPIKGGFPVADRRPNALQARLTQPLFQLFSAKGAQLLPQLLPGGSTLDMPPSCTGTPKVCCAMPAPMCRLQLDFKTVALSPTPPDAIHLETDFALKTLDNLPVDLGIKCNVSLDTQRSGGPTMHVSADIALAVDAATQLTGIKLKGMPAITGIDADDIKVDEPGSNFLCALGQITFIRTAIVASIQTRIATQLSDTVEKQACMTCTDKSDCNSFATDCKSGVCVGADGTNCVQELGLEAHLDLGALLARFAPNVRAFIDALAVAGGYANVDTGISLGLLGGARAAPHSACVPIVAAPVPPPVAPSPTFTANLMPDGKTPFHVGVGVHRSHLDTVGYAAFDGGGLCLHVGTPTVPMLSTQTLGLIIPSLSDLVHVDSAPVYLSTRPDLPPTFTLGKGTFKTDPMTGAKSVDDPLVHISVPSFHMDFYVLIDEHYVRVMTLDADLQLGASLDVDANGKLVPMLGDLTNAFTNLSVTNSELLFETPDDLKQAFPTLLGIAVGQLGSALMPIALPPLMGLQLTPLAVTTTDPDAAGQAQFLALFANVFAATPALQGADTSAELEALVLPPTAEFAVGARGAEAPTAWLHLGGRTIEERPLEWSYSIDEGPWSPFTDEERVAVRDPVLWLQARHHVDVRARAVGLPSSADLTPARVELLVDTLPPEGVVERDGDGALVARAIDRVSPPKALQYRYRLGGLVSPWGATNRLTTPASAGADLATLSVEARDEAGNVGVLAFHGRTTAPANGGGCGCEVGGAAAGAAGHWVAGVLGLAWLWRRRSARLALALAAALGPLAGCNEDELTKGDFEDPIHEIGRYHDLAVRQGVFHVSAYDDALGDLAYARISDLKAAIAWQVIDGLDPDERPEMPGGYRHGVTDDGPDVGLYTSIALTAGGDPRIAYYDVTNGALKFAAGPHPFRTHTVQVAAAGAHVGLYAALSLDAKDVPSIAYMATDLPDGKGGFRSELRLAVAARSDPRAAADWTVSVVDTTAIPCAGRCADGQACVQQAMVNGLPNGDPSISSCKPIDAAPCPTMCAATQVCIGGACTPYEATPRAADLPDGIGLFTQARRTADGHLVLIYHDRSQGDLKVALEGGDHHFTVALVDGGTPDTDVGQFAAAQIGADGQIHVAYVDAIADRLLYKTVSGTTPSSAAEIIDDGVRDDGPHPVGAGAALLVEGSNVRVVYQDQQRSDLWQARRGDGWTREALRSGAAGFGWWPHLVADGARKYLSQFSYDRAQDKPIGRLHIEPLPD